MGPASAWQKNRMEEMKKVVNKLGATIVNEKEGLCVLTDSKEKLEKMVETLTYLGFDTVNGIKVTTVDDCIGGSNIAI